MNTIIGTGFSAKKDTYEASKDASLQARQQLVQRTPNLILVFTSTHFKNKKLLLGINSVFGDTVQIIGCTGFGVITDSGIHRYGVAIMAIQSTTISFVTDVVRDVKKTNARESGSRLARQLLKKLNNKTRESALIISDGLIERGSEVLFGLKELLGRSFPIVGGSSADNLRFDSTGQYFNKEVLNNAIVGTILSGEGNMGYGLKHGWQPIGRPRTVTQSSANVIKKIDDRPAVEIYETYFKKNRKEIESILAQVRILYPIGIYLSDEEEYLLRNPIRIDADGGLVCQGDISTGSQVRLMMGTKESALTAARQAAGEAKYGLKDHRMLCSIIFESASRITLLGYKANEEVAIIKKILGEDLPLIGVCTFSEQAPLKSIGYHGESHFHNETIAVLTLGENRAGIK